MRLKRLARAQQGIDGTKKTVNLITEEMSKRVKVESLPELIDVAS